jgi:hypothetical protein
MKFFVTVWLFFISSISFSQVERADIINYKILSVKKTMYWNSDTLSKEVIQNFYSRAGDDSLEMYNGQFSFRFIPSTENGRVTKLIRYDSKNREDEWHMYKYNKNGSYSIEKVAHGAGTISLARYDKKHICMEEEIESTYTLVFVRNAKGKTEKILLKDKGKDGDNSCILF